MANITEQAKSSKHKKTLETKFNQLSPIRLCVLKYLQHFFQINLKISLELLTIFIQKMHHTSNDDLTLSEDILNSLFSTSNHDIIIYNVKNNLISNFNIIKQRSSYFIIFIENIYDVKYLENVYKLLENSNSFIPILIVFTNQMNRLFVSGGQINDIFQHLISLDFYNINAILLTNIDSIEIITWYPKHENCGKIMFKSVKTISYCQSSDGISINENFNNSIYLPESNFKQCEIIVAARLLEPYAFQDDKNAISGIDIDVINYVAESLNIKTIFVPIIYEINDKYLNGLILR